MMDRVSNRVWRKSMAEPRRKALISLLVWLGTSLVALSAESVRVMSFNIWVGGDAGKQPLSQTMEVIRVAKADVIGLQETGGFEKEKGARRPDNGRKLAEMLGWHY